MKKVFLWGGIVVIGLCVLVTQVQQDSVEESLTDDPIRIGSILILSGDGAAWGTAAKNGIALAVEDINAAGGIDGRMLEVIYEDGKGDPKESIGMYQRLSTLENIDYFIGPNWSPSGLALKDLVDEDAHVMISPSLGVAAFNESSPFVFNTWPHDFLLSEQLAEVLYVEGHRNIALFGGQQVWVSDQTNAVKRRFEALGGTVSLVMEPMLGDKGLFTETEKVLQQEDLDAIVLTSGVYPLGVEFAKRLREKGNRIPLYSMTLDRNIIASANGAYDGLTFYTFLTPEKRFEQAYQDRFTVPVEIGADSAYDAVMMLAEAFRETGSIDTELVSDYLNSIKEYQGMSGELFADGKGGFQKEYRVFEVVDGEPVVLEEGK